MEIDDRPSGRLVTWNRVRPAPSFVVAAGTVPSWLMRRQVAAMHQLDAYWDGDGLRLVSVSDGPSVVNHLVSLVEDRRRTAPLDPPSAITDSKGWKLGKKELGNLRRKDFLETDVPGPRAGTRIEALYVRSQVAAFHPLSGRQTSGLLGHMV